MVPMPSRRLLLEVALASIEDARAAANGGADRLELNAALSLGGLTPSLGALLAVKAATSLPVMVMIRPRAAGFAYSAAEFAIMERDAELALAHGADGLVFGILTAEGTVDVPRCRQLLARRGDCPAVFHRAFDVTPDPFQTLEQLIDLGFRRVLTSGQQASALQGADLIAALIDRAADRIEILPGAGITPATVVEVVTRTGCTQVHGSLRETRTDPSVAARPWVAFGTSAGDQSYEGTSAELVADTRRLLDEILPTRHRSRVEE